MLTRGIAFVSREHVSDSFLRETGSRGRDAEFSGKSNGRIEARIKRLYHSWSDLSQSVNPRIGDVTLSRRRRDDGEKRS